MKVVAVTVTGALLPEQIKGRARSRRTRRMVGPSLTIITAIKICITKLRY